MSVRHLWLPAIATLLLGSVAAWEIRVDDAAGPPDLGARVGAAVDAWRAAGADVDAVERTVLVRYDDAALLGPDALSLVITGGPPGVDFEVVVSADAGEQLDDALVIAIGIALGGTPGVGVLDPRLEADEPRRPGPDDAAALAPGVGLPGDITGDGNVGFDDLLELASAWGRQGINLPADLDGDGMVGDGDLELLREHYRFAPIGDEAAADAVSENPPDVSTETEPGADPAAPDTDAPEPDMERPAPDRAPDVDGLDDADPPDEPMDGEREDEPVNGEREDEPVNGEREDEPVNGEREDEPEDASGYAP